MPPKPHIRVVAARIEEDGRFLLTQRRPEAVLPLLWEFPGGRVAPAESDEDALHRKLKELLGIEVEVGAQTLQVTHEYDGYTLDLMVYRATITKGRPERCRVNDVRWVSPEEFGQYPFPGADQRSVDALLLGE